MIRLSRFALALALLLPTPALAVSVFLNGTQVDGLAGTKIDKCGVEFDAKGNVRLDCPGYAVKVEGAAARPPADAPPPTPTDRITRKYFLVTEQAVQGAAEFDIEVYVNSKFVRRLKNDEEQIVLDVTSHLNPGKNAVTFIARKKSGETRRSFSNEHFFRVIIGEGNAAGDRVMIEEAVATFQRTAADTQDATEELSVLAR